MTASAPLRNNSPLLATLLIAGTLIVGCGKTEEKPADNAYVSVPEATLRDRVAAVYNKVGTVKNGEKVRILDRSANKRFIKVHAPSGAEGWIEQRYLVEQPVYDAFQKLAHDNTSTPAQAIATTRRIMNMHVLPARDSDKLYQINEGSKVELLKRSSTPKEGMKALEQERVRAQKEEEKAEKDKDTKEVKDPEPDEAKPASPADKALAAHAKHKASPPPPPSPLEDWWLVRDSEKRVGWVLGRMLDVDIPLEIAQYAEGQRVVAAFVLNKVEDHESGKSVPQYAVLFSENRDGLPYDFDQLRIFTWNVKRSRYETAYREHNLTGVLPFTVTTSDYGKEGKLPTFIVRQRGDNGSVVEQKYKMNGVIVRRVLAEGEQPTPTRPASRHRRRKG